MRSIHLIVVHCSATRCNRAYPVTTLIRDHQQRFGFTGYHYYVTRDGHITQTRHLQLPGAHARGYNAHSIGVCYEGGLDARGETADTRTPAQKAAMRRLLEELHGRYPRAVIVGHHDLNPQKPCPCIENVVHEYADLQPKEK